LKEYFRKGPGIAQLQSVLKAYANYRPKIGYVQGMNFLVGYLLIKLKNEEDAFWVFVGIMQAPRYDLAGLFTAEFPKMYCGAYQLDRMMTLKIPRLHAHLKALQIEPTIYLCKWLLTMYSNLMTEEALELTWDQFLDGGWAQLIRVTFAILQEAEPEILQIKDFGNVVKYLTADMWKKDHIATVRRVHTELASEKARVAGSSELEWSEHELNKLEMEYLLKAHSESRANVLAPAPKSKLKSRQKLKPKAPGWDSWEMVATVAATAATVAVAGVFVANATAAHAKRR